MRIVRRNRLKAFTLAELLISIAILGVIATFTIPKVLQAQQSQRWSAEAKEAAATISSAYTLYKQTNTATASTMASDLTQYMNYVNAATSGNIDHIIYQANRPCDATLPCLMLHNGAALMPGAATNNFGGTTQGNYIYFFFDPDGKDSGNTIGPGKSIVLMLYFNGRVSESSTRSASDTTYIGASAQNWGPDSPSDWWNNWN